MQLPDDDARQLLSQVLIRNQQSEFDVGAIRIDGNDLAMPFLTSDEATAGRAPEIGGLGRRLASAPVQCA